MGATVLRASKGCCRRLRLLRPASRPALLYMSEPFPVLPTPALSDRSTFRRPLTSPPPCGMGQLPSVRRFALTLAHLWWAKRGFLRCRRVSVAFHKRAKQFFHAFSHFFSKSMEENRDRLSFFHASKRFSLKSMQNARLLHPNESF